MVGGIWLVVSKESSDSEAQMHKPQSVLYSEALVSYWPLKNLLLPGPPFILGLFLGLFLGLAIGLCVVLQALARLRRLKVCLNRRLNRPRKG